MSFTHVIPTPNGFVTASEEEYKKYKHALRLEELKHIMTTGTPEERFSAFLTMLEESPEKIKALLSMPRLFNQMKVKEFVTLDKFLQLSKAYPRQATLIAKTFFATSLITSAEEFDRVCSYNLELGLQLLEHKQIATLLEKIEEKTKQKIKLNMPLKERVVFEQLLKSPWQATSLSIAALNLEHKSQQPVPKKKSYTDIHANVDPIDMKAATKLLIKKIPTIHSYFHHMMFGRNGFYSSGRVKIDGTDFETSATKKNTTAFAPACAYQLLMTWRHLIETKKLKETDPFNVLECGAGNGNLCRDILSTIQKMEKLGDPTWKKLSAVLHYHIVELSPELITRQKKATAPFKNVSIINADARNFSKHEQLRDKKMAVVFSNELIDMFSLHAVALTEQQKVLVKSVLVWLDEDKYKKYYEKHKHLPTPEKLAAEDPQLRNLVAIFSPTETEQDEKDKKNERKFLLLSEENFLKIHATINNPKDLDLFKFEKRDLAEAAHVPEVADFLQQHPDIPLKTNPDNIEDYHLEVGVNLFLRNVNDVLMDEGETWHFDYGNNRREVATALRTIKPQTCFNIFDTPAFQDLTHSIDFTTLVEEGSRLGWKNLYYGKQADLILDRFPPSAVSEREKLEFKTASISQRFHMSFQRKTSPQKADEKQPDVKSREENLSARFSGPRLPVTRLELFSELTSKLKPKEENTQGTSGTAPRPAQ